MKKFIYLHIPKTAGSSFHTILDENCKKFIRLRAINSPGVNRGEEKWDTIYPKFVKWLNGLIVSQKYDVISGHIRFKDITDKGVYELVTIIRHPVERTISHYFYLSYYGGLESWNDMHHFDITKDMSLLEFAEKERNYQHRYIGNYNNYSFIGLQDYFYPQTLNKFSKYLNCKKIENVITNSHNQKAIVSIEERNQIEKLNDLDMELFYRVKKEYNK